MAKEKKDYSYNIFENVSKEQFIEDLKDKNSLLKIFGSILSFDFVKEQRVIIDITNYEEEIKYFNSFNVFKYDNRIRMIEDNFQKYIDSRNIKQITYQRKLKKEFDLFKNTKSFEKHLEYHKRGKISDEIAPILFEKIGNPIIEKFKLALRERFREFCFHHKTIEAGKLPKFIFRFYNFEEAKMYKRLTDVELDIHLFDEFELSIYGIYFTKSKDELLDIRLNLVTEFCDCFSVVAEYLGYEVYIGANQITTFGDGENYFTFKKIA